MTFILPTDGTDPKVATKGGLESAVNDAIALAGISIIAATWSELSGISGTRNGQPASVAKGDTGTHTDPVTGDTVDNAAMYSWDQSNSAWAWVGYSDAAQTALDRVATGEDRVQTGLDVIAAESARDSALINGTIYDDTVDGINGTTTGEYFAILSPNQDRYVDLYKNTAGTAVYQDTMPNKAAIDSVRLALDETKVLGRDVPLATASYLSPGRYVLAEGFAFDGVIEEFRADVLAACTVQVAPFVKDGDDFTRVGSWTPVSLETGDNTVTVSIPVIKGQLLGFYIDTASRMRRTTGITDPDGGGYYFGAGDGETFTDATITNTVQLEVGVTYTRQYVNTARVQSQDNRIMSVEAAFTTSPAINLYDPSLAQDQTSMNLAPNGLNPVASRMFFGFQAVEAGKTYTVKMGHWIGFNPVQRFNCLDSTGAWLGIDQASGGTTVAPNPPTGITWTGNNEVTFTIPAESAIRYMGIASNDWVGHDTAGFEQVIASIQWQEGAEATKLQLPTAAENYLRLRPEALQEYDFAPLLRPTSTQLVAHFRDGKVYLRGVWNATHDVTVAFGQNLRNATPEMPNFSSLRLIDVDSFNLPHAYNTASINWGIEPEDVGPLNYNGTYIGANHGVDDAVIVVATGHGKTNADEGSVWTDGLSRRFVLMRVIDEDNLHFLSENQSVYPAWSFFSSISGSTLTHAEDAVNTSAITADSSYSSQFNPGSRGFLIDIRADGVPMVEDVPVLASAVEFKFRYSVSNPASVVAYARSQAGVAQDTDYYSDQIEPDAYDDNIVTFSAMLGAAFSRSVTMLNETNFSHIYALQAVKQEVSGSEILYSYVPRMDVLATGEDLSSEYPTGSTTLLLTSDYYADPLDPPLSVCQIVKDGSTRKRSFTLGLVPGVGTGDKAGRSAVSDRVGVIASTKKQYVNMVQTDATAVAGTSYDCLAYRGLSNLDGDATAREFFWFRAAGSIYVVVDFHTADSFRRMDLPASAHGKPISILENSGVTVHNGAFVGVDGLLMSASQNGRAILKIEQ